MTSEAAARVEHERVAADRTGLGDGAGIDEDDHVGHCVTFALVDHEGRAGVGGPVDGPERVAFEVFVGSRTPNLDRAVGCSPLL